MRIYGFFERRRRRAATEARPGPEFGLLGVPFCDGENFFFPFGHLERSIQNRDGMSD